MRTVETSVYKFSELSEQAKQKAIEKHYDINVNYDWWEFTYEDAKQVHLKINGFDLYRRNIDIGIESGFTVKEVCEAIIKNHGEACDTHATAKKYMEQITVLEVKAKMMGEEYAEDEGQSEMDDILTSFTEDIEACYLSILDKEYDYLTSEESIIETIEANEYEFEEDGSRF